MAMEFKLFERFLLRQQITKNNTRKKGETRQKPQRINKSLHWDFFLHTVVKMSISHLYISFKYLNLNLHKCFRDF